MLLQVHQQGRDRQLLALLQEHLVLFLMLGQDRLQAKGHQLPVRQAGRGFTPRAARWPGRGRVWRERRPEPGNTQRPVPLLAKALHLRGRLQGFVRTAHRGCCLARGRRLLAIQPERGSILQAAFWRAKARLYRGMRPALGVL
jgi:hypothetical protein